MKKPGPTYAAPINREDLTQGVFLVSLRGASDKDNARNRQRAFDHVMEQFEEGLAPFDGTHCFDNGLSEDDLMYVPSSPELIMSKAKTAPADDTTTPEQDDIILAASEILELAKLKVSLANAYRDARQYKELVFKVVDAEGGHLSDDECAIVADKSFAKSIKGLADAKVKVSMWYENSSGNHELILNELAFMDEEIVTALETAEKNGKASKKKEAVEAE